MTDQRNYEREITVWERNLLGICLGQTPELLPGLLAVSILTWFSIWLGDVIGKDLLGFDKSPISPVMIAIILGLTISSLVTLPNAFKLGLTFSVKKLLRLGIILLGIRLTFFDVFKLGAFGVPIVILCIAGALLIATRINKKLNLPERLGTLIAVGTSICGVTAIVATSPAIDADEEETAYAITVITIFGLFATLVYPYLANTIFAGHALKAGLFLGTAVHETAQVVGAAKIYADIYAQATTLDVATVAKLVRNVFMALVIPFMTYIHIRQVPAEGEIKGKRTNISKLLPLFILGFLGTAALRSIGDTGINSNGLAFGLLTTSVWGEAISAIKFLAEILLIAALAGVGLGTNFRSMKALGVRPFIVGLAASLSVGVVSWIAVTLLGSIVIF